MGSIVQALVRSGGFEIINSDALWSRLE